MKYHQNRREKDLIKTQSVVSTVAAGLAIQLCVGILYLWSVFKLPIVHTFHWSVSSANMVSSFMMLSFVFGNLVGGYLQDKTNPRRVATIGCTMFCLGILLTSFLTERTISFIYITYCLMSGLGSGFAYGSVISCIQKCFPNRCGLASGLAVSAFGLSTVFFSPISQWLMNKYISGERTIVTGAVTSTVPIYNFSMVFKVLAVVFFVMTMTACYFLKMPRQDKQLSSEGAMKNRPERHSVAPRQVLRTRTFRIIALNIFFINGTWNLIVPLIKDLGMARGLNAETAVLIVSLTGIASAGGRFIMASVSDKIGRIPSMLILAGGTFVCAVIMIGGHGIFFAVAVLIIAFGQGGPSAIHPAIVTDIFGPKYSGTNYGLAMVALGISSIVFNAAANFLYTLTGGYTATFIMAAFSASMPFLLMKLLKERQPSEKGAEAIASEAIQAAPAGLY